MPLPLPALQGALVDVFVPGEPKTKGSPSGFVVGKPGERQRAIVTHKEASGTTGWLRAVRYHVQQATTLMVPAGFAVRVELAFVLPRPKTAPKKRSGYALAAKRPDLDKLVRCCFDAIAGVVLADDSQVVKLSTDKRVAEIGERSGVHIRIWGCS